MQNNLKKILTNTFTQITVAALVLFACNGAYAQQSYTHKYSNLNAGSSAVLVVGLDNNEVLYQKNANASLPVASITKILTAMVVLDKQHKQMNDEIILKRSDFKGPKTARSRLRVGDRLNRAELLLLALMKSENPAAKALARNYPGGYKQFMRNMNKKARDLGMMSSWFGDPTGLDKRNVASATDLVRLLKAAGEYDLIRHFSVAPSYNFKLRNRVYRATNTSYLVRDAKRSIGISKTGFIREAGRCYVMETLVNDRPVAVVILGAKNSRARWRDAENILNFLSGTNKYI